MNLFFALTLMAAQPSYSIEETITQCAALQDSDDRLACFDQLATIVTGGASAPTTAQAPADPQAAVVAAAPQAPRVKSEMREEPAAKSQSDQRYVILRADDPKLEALERGGFLSGFFTREKYEAKIVATKRNNMGILFIQTDNGEIWRENRPALRHEPEKGETIVFEPGVTGGWYAVFPSVDRKTKMRRFDIEN